MNGQMLVVLGFIMLACVMEEQNGLFPPGEEMF